MDLATVLNAYPAMRINIVAYMDNQGDDSRNLEVSEMRAAEILNWMVQNQIDPNRVTAKGMGEAKPISSNDTFEGQEKNRRVEICVVNKK